MSARLTADEREMLRIGLRLAVRVGHIGPNSADVIARGGAVCLTPEESEDAAIRLEGTVERIIADRIATVEELADGYGHAGQVDVANAITEALRTPREVRGDV